MYDEIRKLGMRVTWRLREVYIVTQWKNGCVYRTKSVGMIACAPEYADWLQAESKGSIIVASISTKVSRQLMEK